MPGVHIRDSGVEVENQMKGAADIGSEPSSLLTHSVRTSGI